MGVHFLGLGHRGIRWVIPSQIGINCPSDNLRHWQTFLLTPLFQLFLLSRCDVAIASFFGHLSHPYFPSTDTVVYNSSTSERRKQGLCWSTSTSLMAIRSNSKPLKKRYALCNSSATNASVCGWMASVSPKTTCRPIVLSWHRNSPSPADSTPKPVRP